MSDSPSDPPPPAPVRPNPPPAPASARSGPPPAAGPSGRSDRGHKGGPRPAPVRQGVEAAPRDPPQPIEPPLRALQAEGGHWIVREGGLTAAGTGQGPRAPLLLILFSSADDPATVAREVLVAARRLNHLSDEELVTALARSRPYLEERGREEVFPDTRKRGSNRL
ncbi:MAG: hypothetical protein EXR95_10335 [Gemmatimonadetes bacterium]|nr:hypothetical protein [Gemmatimonadota bacterium]